MELTKIRYVNEKREKEFNKLGIFNTAHLMQFFPRSYLDLRESQLLKYAYHNDIVLTAGKVLSVPMSRYFKRGGLVKIACEQEGFMFSVVWFNQPYVAEKLKVGEEYLFYGRVRIDGFEVSIVNPSFEPCEKNFRLKGIVPQYAIKNYLTQKLFRDAVKVAVDVEKPKSIIPIELQTKYSLMNLCEAYREVHNPSSFDKMKIASNRIAVEEYFSIISAFKFIKGDKTQVRLNRYTTTVEELLEFIVMRFPFDFTEGQKKAVNDIFRDMKGESVMNRLMQGDVGSGKTAVSECAIFIAVNSGYQVAMLAPTEVLARQNYQSIKRVFPDYNVALITGSMTAKEKRDTKKQLQNGFINIIVGTHALLTEDVEFKNLSLCICDEQQRFGVAQRSSLLSKGITPDVLVMSATPIPRTLSLIFYGDLDITTITDKPKMRVEIQTNIVPEHKYLDMLGFIKNEVKEGRQAYFVCPKIEGDEEGSVMSAIELFEDIKSKLSDERVGLLHGKMKDKEKNAVMEEFKNKNIDVLVCTTVVEVGVDVPDASVIVIHDAERFGLSQLHQLRGRVGRSGIKSYCFLMTKTKDSKGLERLKVIKDNSDGFKISEYDYKMRGAGDFMGDKQSGKFMHDLGHLSYNTESIFLAKKLSDEFFDSGKNIEIVREIALKKYEKIKDITLN